MRDLTQGSVTKHLLYMTAFFAASMFAQTLYLVVDIYWVGRLGREAIAAVSVAGNLLMGVAALTQVLGVGATTVISQAAGRKDPVQARILFNQAFVLSILLALMVGLFGFLYLDVYCASLSADIATAKLAKMYLLWFIPALLLQFPLVAMGSGLRAIGVIKPAVGFQLLSVLLDMVLSPLLIFGLGPFPDLGIVGAALATFISILIADILIIIYFQVKCRYLNFQSGFCRPDFAIWKSISRIGLPAGAELVLLSLYFTLVYNLIRGFGAAAQAGFGVGTRIMQALFLPVVALSFALAPIVGQNFGARLGHRVRRSFFSALGIASMMMFLATFVVYCAPTILVSSFSSDAKVIEFGSEYLKIISVNFVPAGIIFVTSSVFQGIGNSFPPLISWTIRLLVFVGPALILSRTAGFEIKQLWFLSVASQCVHAGMNLLLLHRESRKASF